MTITITIRGLYRRNAGEAFLDRLGSIYPEGRIRHYFEAQLPIQDPRLRTLCEILTEAGWTVWAGSWPSDDRELLCKVTYDYSSADLDECEYFWLRASSYLFTKTITGETWKPFGDAGREEGRQAGRLKLISTRFLPQAVDVACAGVGGYWLVVPDRVKRILNKRKLKGCRFLETLPYRPNRRRGGPPTALKWGDDLPPWWELRSDVLTPPALPPRQWDAEAGPIRPLDLLQPEKLPWPLFIYPEMHFRRSDLQSIAPFDLAEVPESFEKKHPISERPLIASQRFRQACVKHGIQAQWVPVRLQDDG